MLEKRQHFRERLRKPIRVKLLPRGDAPALEVEAWVVDLSFGGALLHTGIEIAGDSSVELELPLEADQPPMRVTATVLRCQAHPRGFSVGVHFATELKQASGILAENILFTYNNVIHSQMN